MGVIPISVVVCTHNRLEKLRRCIAAFENIKTDHQWELVIVDNASIDGTYEYLLSLPRQIGNASFRTAREPRPGKSIALNTGVALARGDIIAFTDDDCYVAQDYVDSTLRAFDDPAIGFIGGRILLYDKSDLPITINESNEPKCFQPYSFIAAGDVQGANMAFRKHVLNSIDGFDERFATLATNDVEAVAAALWAGFFGRYDPRPTVFHHHQRRTKAHSHRLFRYYEVGRGAYFAKFIFRNDTRYCYLWHWVAISKASLCNIADIRQAAVFLRARLREAFGFFCFCRIAVTNHFSRSHRALGHDPR
jgi:glycosyltransferase involved in cell wall biosynthesis